MKHRMCQTLEHLMDFRWLLVNLLVLLNCGRGRCCQRPNSLRRSSCNGRLIGFLLCYKSTDNRGRLNGWSCTVRLDELITCRHLRGLLRSLLGSFEESYRCGSNAVGSADMCKTSFFTHFCHRKFSSLCFPMGKLQNQTSSAEQKELALWFFGNASWMSILPSTSQSML